MGNSTSINLRIDKELKKEAESLFDKLGINMTSAINIFLKQAVREQALPFKVSANSIIDNYPEYKGRLDQYKSYEDFVADSLRQADNKVAEGSMKYYNGEEIIERLEALLEKV